MELIILDNNMKKFDKIYNLPIIVITNKFQRRFIHKNEVIKMTNNLAYKMFLLPILVAVISTLCIQFVEKELESELIDFSMYEDLIFLGIIFLTIYIFIIVIAMPIEFYLSSKLKNKILSFILFNIIGLILISIIFWIMKDFELDSLYLIFPLFGVLTFFQPNFIFKGK